MTITKASIFKFPEVRVVEASAGSGKTYALAKRYIQLILNPKLAEEQSAIRQILALTFTNKAAYEMKARILQFLKKIALGTMDSVEEEEILRPIGVSVKEAQAKAYYLMDEVIHNYNYFQIQTIDKFINAILSGCAFKIGLTANFKIKTNAAEYLEHSLDQLIDRAHTDKDIRGKFQTFLNNYLFIENRTGWFPKKDMLDIIFTLFNEDNTYGQVFNASPILSEDIIKLKKSILYDIKTLKEKMPEGVNKTFLKSTDAFLNKYTNSFDIDGLSTYFKNDALPVNKGVQVDRDIDKLWDKIVKEVRTLCELEAASLFNPYIFVYDEVKEGVETLTAKDDILFLSELNKKATRLFDEERVTVEELYYRLATRFHHYLLDEFQDTSRLQWHNVEEMVREALSTGGTLFYVGDRKQAIYGFRGGDVNLFDEIKDKFNDFNVCPETLANNWRSQKAIVNFNNHIFSEENLRGFIQRKRAIDEAKKSNKHTTVYFDDEQVDVVTNLFATSKQTHQKDRDGGYVHLEYVDIGNKEERDEYIHDQFMTLMDDLKGRFALSDIAVLARSNAHIEQVTNWLMVEGIPVQSERTSNIQENQTVLSIISFLRFIDSPINNIAFAEFILSDVFARATGTKTGDWHKYIFSKRSNIVEENDFYLYTAFRKDHPKLWDDFLSEFFRSVGLYPLYELVVSFYTKFDCLTYFPDDQGFLMHLLELIKKQEEEVSDLSAFLTYFDNLTGEELYVHSTKTEAVNVLTIHKSKGLEFPVVIIPFLGMDVQIGHGAHDNKQSFVSLLINGKRNLLRLKAKYYLYSDTLYQIYADEYRTALVSEINNVYVALTRAGSELYGFIPKKVGQSNNIAKLLIPEELYTNGARQTSKQIKAQISPEPLEKAEYYDWIKYLNEEFVSIDQVRNRTVRRQGEIIHRFLALFENTTVKAEQIIELDRQNIDMVIDSHEMSKLKNHTVAILSDAAFARFFNVPDAEVYNEIELITEEGHTKRIDRLMIFENELWVIDYKYTDEMKDEYRDQVKEYMGICRGIYSGKNVKGYVLLTKNKKVIEVT